MTKKPSADLVSDTVPETAPEASTPEASTPETTTKETEPETSALAAITPEIDNAVEEIIGEARLKSYVPGQILFDYRNLLNQRLKKAEGIEEERKAIYNSQVWLLCQAYEVVEPNGSVRPLGLDDVASMDGELLAFTVSGLMSINLDINFLDDRDSLKETFFFEVIETGQRFRVQNLSVEKAIELQQVGQKDPTGIKMVQWLICEKITLNNEPIKEEDFKTKIDFSTAAVLESRINFLLEKYQQKKTSFSIRSFRTGHTAT